MKETEVYICVFDELNCCFNVTIVNYDPSKRLKTIFLKCRYINIHSQSIVVWKLQIERVETIEMDWEIQ